MMWKGATLFFPLLFIGVCLLAAPQNPKDALLLNGAELTLRNAGKLRDPFRKPQLKIEKEEAITKLPDLESFAIEDLQLVGVMTGPKQRKALISAPGGKMFIIAENTKIGLRRGYVRKITPNRIVVSERMVNLLGEEEKNDSYIEFSSENKKEGLGNATQTTR